MPLPTDLFYCADLEHLYFRYLIKPFITPTVRKKTVGIRKNKAVCLWRKLCLDKIAAAGQRTRRRLFNGQEALSGCAELGPEREGTREPAPVGTFGSKLPLRSRAKVTLKRQQELRPLECCKDFVYFQGKLVAGVFPQALN